MSSFLTGTAADGSPGHWPLDEAEFFIGRRPPADLVLPFPQVSRRHALIAKREGWCYLSDLGSRNGTFVNGEPVGTEPVRLAGGDEIVVGGVAALVFNDPDETIAGSRVGRLQGVWIDPVSNEVWVDAVCLAPPLSRPQLLLLHLLYERVEQPVSQTEIVAVVWPDEDPGGVSKQALEGLVKRLRGRLREAGAAGKYIQVVRGYGLKLTQAA